MTAITLLGLLLPAGCNTDTNNPVNFVPVRSRIFLLGRLLLEQTCNMRLIYRVGPDEPTPVSVAADLSEIGGEADQELASGDNGTWRWAGEVTPDMQGERLITITAVDRQGQKKEASKRFRVFNTDKAIAITAGYCHSLAVKADGTVVTWEIISAFSNTTKCGLPQFRDMLIVPEGLSDVVDASAGEYQSLVLKADGTVIAWGDYFDTDFDEWRKMYIPEGLVDVVAISAGAEHNLALKADGTVVCWGRNGQYEGQCNIPSGLSDVVAIDGNIALKADGTVVCWGGPEVPEYCRESNFFVGLRDVVAVSRSGSTLVLMEDGTVTWTLGGYEEKRLPMRTGNFKAKAIAAGGGHNMALCDDRIIVRWWSSALAIPFYVNHTKPQNFIAIAQGKCINSIPHSMALDEDGGVLSWEDCWYGPVFLPVPEDLQ